MVATEKASGGSTKEGTKDGLEAWVIAVAGSMMLALSMGVFRSLGILLVELIEVFEAPTAEASVLMASFGTAFIVSAFLLNTTLGGIIHERALVIIGATVGCCGLIICFFATQLEVVTISFGVGLGVHTQTAVTSSQSLTARYFNRRMGLAMGVVISGSSVGIFVWPVLIRYLLNEYTYRGASLILAGIVLNSYICAALMKPFPGTTIESEPVMNNACTTQRPNSTEETNSAFAANREDNMKEKTVSKQLTRKSEERTNLRDKMEVAFGEPKKQSERTYSGTQPSTAGTNGEPQEQSLQEENTTDPASSVVNLQRMQGVPLQRQKTNALKRFVMVKRNKSQQSFSLKDAFPFELLKDPIFQMFQLYTLIDISSSQYALQFYPAVTNELGFTEYESALLLSVIGICGIAGRLVWGFIGDKVSNRYKIVIGAQAAFGTTVFLCRFARTLWSQVLYTTSVGIFYSVSLTYKMPLIRDFFADANLPKITALTACMDGLSFVAGGPLIGWIRDLTGGYEVPTYLVTSLLFLNCGILFTIGLVHRNRTRKQQACVMEQEAPEVTVTNF